MPLHHTAYLCLRAPPSPAILSPHPHPRRLLHPSLASMLHAQPATTRLRRTAPLPGAPRPLFPRPTSRPGPLPARASPMDLVRHEAGLQSTRLDPRLREAVERVVETLGGRVTVGDVAARAGIKLADADTALKALAYDTQASLKVSSSGEVVFGFALDFRARLLSRSLILRATPLARSAASAAAYLARVTFGSALIASVIIVWMAVLALLSGRDNKDDRQGGRSSFHSTGVFMDVSDILFYWDPAYYRSSAQRVSAGEPLNFVEAIFSFVFGDGDPNADFEERRWQRLADMIRAKGGVVTAEEMAPYLDPPEPEQPPRPTTSSLSSYVPYPDESFVLPALIKYGGEPVVDEQGRLLYRFPALLVTGVNEQRRRGFWRWRGAAAADRGSFEVPLEQSWGFTAASEGQLVGITLLGCLNILGVFVLSGLLADPRAPYQLAAQGMGWLLGIMTPLKLYATAFFAIPGIRLVLTVARNAAITRRNETREAAVELLDAGAAPVVEDKVAAARALAAAEAEAAGAHGSVGPRLVDEGDIIFDSGREVSGQLEGPELEAWDQQMAKRGRGEGEGREGGSSGYGRGSGGGGGGGWW